VKKSLPMASGRPANPDDAQVVAALRAGDETAFAKLVDDYGPTLLRLALTHVPNRAVGEEVVQETWLAVLSGIDRFEGRSSLRTWITSIVLNIARSRGERERRTLPISFLRRRSEEGRPEPAVDPDRFQGRRGERPGWWAAPPDRWEEPDERLSREHAQSVLLDAIKRLPARQREVITLRDLGGWSADEACNVLGISETNQRVLLHRARAKVRATLEDHFQEGQLL
jgi:RNA polymerase sigma-70 factor (ECF subfamily)